VRYAQPNYIVQTTAVPNDELYAFQWHYPAINMPAAWDITTGSPDVVVAVVDTGILHSFGTPSLTHPDFVGKVLPGYDFISDFRMAGDGDGRDPDPYDVGDDPSGQSSYHGSHVAGTVAAATNNGIGVAGVDWNAMILPIRALGIGGGTVFDVVGDALGGWPPGRRRPRQPEPRPRHQPEPRRGVHLHRVRAGRVRLDRVLVAAPIDRGRGRRQRQHQRRAVLPASCRNVITVGATDALGRRAPYSNYGSRVDVMAPGGDMSADRTGDGYPDGVLSVARDDATGADGHWFMQGTSMAAPHVAGVASLMKALDPDLTQAEGLAALQATARPLSASDCTRPSGEECGAGLIDAAAALALVRDDEVPTPGVGDLAFEPGALDFGTFTASLDVTLRNTGASPLSGRRRSSSSRSLNPGDMLDLSV
jgi:serine protease